MSDSMIPIAIIVEPGMDKDSSAFDTKTYLGGQHVRFYDNKPQKIGGYKLIDWGNKEIVKSLFSIERQGSVDIYLGRASSLIKGNYTEEGSGGDPVDRTPISIPHPFIPAPTNIWDFDIITATTGVEYIVAVATQNNSGDLNNNVQAQVFYGDITNNAPLDPLINTVAPNDPITTDGGVVTIGNAFVFLFGSGEIKWSKVGDPSTFPVANTYPVPVKAVQGISVRGGGVPAGLFWTLNNLIRATYNPNSPTPGDFGFDVLADNISILAPRSVLYANGEYWWVGIDHILKFNGTIEKVENNSSTNYFYRNLNYNQKSKIHAFHNALYSEIHIFWPKGSAIECTDVLILNYSTGYFFNTVMNRAASQSATTSFSFPVMSDNVASVNLGVSPPPGSLPDLVYPLWMHEYKFDQFKGSEIFAIYTEIETNLFSCRRNAPDAGDKMMRIEKFEPDFVQEGQMEVRFGLRTSPQSQPVYTDEGKYIFQPDTEVIGIHEQGGLVSLRFISNTIGGNFYMGEPTIHITPGDDRLRF